LKEIMGESGLPEEDTEYRERWKLGTRNPYGVGEEEEKKNKTTNKKNRGTQRS
jgi:hypothetical protein